MATKNRRTPSGRERASVRDSEGKGEGEGEGEGGHEEHTWPVLEGVCWDAAGTERAPLGDSYDRMLVVEVIQVRRGNVQHRCGAMDAAEHRLEQQLDVVHPHPDWVEVRGRWRRRGCCTWVVGGDASYICSHVLVDEVLEGASRGRGRVPEAARISVGGEHVLLCVPIGQAVRLESAGLRGQAPGQGLLADVGVTEMAQGVPLNAVHQDATGVEIRGVGRCQMLVVPNV